MTKKGKRKTRHDVRQRYKCAACRRLFVKEAAEHSSYPVKLIMEGVSRYNLGYSAHETVHYLKHRFGLAVPEKTFRRWYTSHKPLCTYHHIRTQIRQHYQYRVRAEATNLATGVWLRSVQDAAWSATASPAARRRTHSCTSE